MFLAVSHLHKSPKVQVTRMRTLGFYGRISADVLLWFGPSILLTFVLGLSAEEVSCQNPGKVWRNYASVHSATCTLYLNKG